MKPQKPPILLIAALILCVSLACSLPNVLGGAVRDAVDEQVQAFTQNAPTAAHLDQPTTGPDQTQEEAGSLVEQVQGTAQSLGSAIFHHDTSMLNSFRTTFRIQTEDPNESNGLPTSIIQIEEAVNRPEEYYHNKVHTEGDAAGGEPSDVDLYVLGDQTYLYNLASGETPCIMIGGDDSIAEAGYLRPEDFFKTLETGELVESSVMMNGVLTDHYMVLHSDMETDDTTAARGDVWVAQEGEYIVRYTGQVEGRINAEGGFDDGTVTWEYNLFDANQSVAPTLPPECENLPDNLEEIPVPENARNKEMIAGIITFESPDSPEQVGDFYREQLPAQGWRITEDTAMPSLVMLTAEKDSQSLQIMITPGTGANTSVIISAIPLQ